MFSEAYTKLELDDVAVIVDHVNKLTDGSIFDPLETTVLAVEPSFYPDWRYLDVSDHATNPPLQCSVLQNGKDYVLMNWSYDTIYDLNEKVPIQLTDHNVLDYVRFFFAHVRGRHGQFKIAESMDAMAWKDDLSLEMRKSIAQLVVPMHVDSKQDNGVYKVKAVMMLGDALFKTDVYVEPKGQVVMADQEILVEELPVLDQVFGQ